MQVHPENAGLLAQIAASHSDLRPSEKKVHAVIIDNPTRSSRATLAEIASLAGVSEPSVLRFVRALGYGGFQDFKYALIQSLAPGIPATLRSLRLGDSVATITNKVFDQSIAVLRRTRDLVDSESLAAAVSAISGSENILVLGFGASGVVGQDIAQKFVLFGIPVHAPIDYHQQFMAATLAGPKTVVIAVSNTAATSEVLESARQAKERGASIIALCGQVGEITEMAHIVLRHSTEDTEVYTPTSSRLAALVIVDILAIAIAAQSGAGRIAELEHMKSRLSRMRHGVRLANQSFSPNTDEDPRSKEAKE
jgi:RpiR family carbohydrate utilization transcriptional regulator